MFNLCEIHCYLSPPKSWDNNSFLGSVIKFKPCPFGSGLTKFALDFVFVISFKNAEEITSGSLILYCRPWAQGCPKSWVAHCTPLCNRTFWKASFFLFWASAAATRIPPHARYSTKYEPHGTYKKLTWLYTLTFCKKYLWCETHKFKYNYFWTCIFH